MCCRTLRRRVLHHFPLWWARDLWEERPPARSVSSHYYNEGWYPLSRPRTQNNSGHICLWHCFKFSELYLKKKILNHWNSYLINMCDMESWIHDKSNHFGAFTHISEMSNCPLHSFDYFLSFHSVFRFAFFLWLLIFCILKAQQHLISIY